MCMLTPQAVTAVHGNTPVNLYTLCLCTYIRHVTTVGEAEAAFSYHDIRGDPRKARVFITTRGVHAYTFTHADISEQNARSVYYPPPQ